MIERIKKRGRVVELPAFCQQCLIEQYSNPIVEVLFFLFQTHHHRVAWVNFHDRLCSGRLLPCGLEHTRHVSADIMFVGHQAGG